MKYFRIENTEIVDKLNEIYRTKNNFVSDEHKICDVLKNEKGEIIVPFIEFYQKCYEEAGFEISSAEEIDIEIFLKNWEFEDKMFRYFISNEELVNLSLNFTDLYVYATQSIEAKSIKKDGVWLYFNSIEIVFKNFIDSDKIEMNH